MDVEMDQDNVVPDEIIPTAASITDPDGEIGHSFEGAPEMVCTHQSYLFTVSQLLFSFFSDFMQSDTKNRYSIC